MFIKNKKKGAIRLATVALLSISIFAGCATVKDQATTSNTAIVASDSDRLSTEETMNSVASTSSESQMGEVTQENVIKDSDTMTTSSSQATNIVMENSGVTIDGNGAEYKNNNVYITQAGEYLIEGTMEGQIIINSETDGDVHIILNGVDLTSSEAAPIYVIQSDNTIITLAEGTTNTIIDNSVYMEETESESDIERINGAIYSKDDLAINGEGVLEITATNINGILVKDSLTIVSGTINVTSKLNGIKGKDLLMIADGEINIVSGEDGLKSNDYIQIDGGVINIEAEDDGVHSDATVEVNGGEIYIVKSYEGLEGLDIIINDGEVYVASYDDGINIATKSEETETVTMGRGGGGETVLEGHGLYINGGLIYVNAYGDGLDSNGYIWMNGGTVIVSGPTDAMNGSLDYNGELIITGGYLIAAGGNSVAVPSTDSTIASIVYGLATQTEAGSVVIIKDSEGNELANYAPDKEFQSIVFTSPDLENGKTYQLFIDGELIESIEITDTITYAGETLRQMGGPMTGQPGGGMRRP